MKRIGMLLIVMGVAGVTSAHDNGREARPSGCSDVLITAPGLRRQPRDLTFSTRQILDLEFRTRLERPYYGEHVLHFDVFTPSGFLYQKLSIHFNWPKPKPRRWGWHDRDDDRTVPASASVPTGLPVLLLGDTHRGRPTDTVETRLPVAGTSITMSTLYGRWTVQAFMDDATRPCSSKRSFTIRGQ
jgi:hypothetical protein